MLSLSPTLTAASRWKSLHQAGYGYFGHDDPASPVARSAYQRAKDCDFNGTRWGKNIAWGYASAQAVTSGWSTRTGIARTSRTPPLRRSAGVAANASGRLYWTQNFGNDADSHPPPPPPPPPGDTEKPSAPSAVTATSVTQARPELSWTAAKDNVGVTGYGVYLDAERHEVGTELTRSRYAFCRILISPQVGGG